MARRRKVTFGGSSRKVSFLVKPRIQLEIDHAVYKKLKKLADAEGISIDEMADKIFRWRLRDLKRRAGRGDG